MIGHRMETVPTPLHRRALAVSRSRDWWSRATRGVLRCAYLGLVVVGLSACGGETSRATGDSGVNIHDAMTTDHSTTPTDGGSGRESGTGGHDATVGHDRSMPNPDASPSDDGTESDASDAGAETDAGTDGGQGSGDSALSDACDKLACYCDGGACTGNCSGVLGHCVFHCGSGATCMNSCEAGFCQFDCAPGSTCVNGCGGGFCETSCAPGATCVNGCGGGFCETSCASGATCSTTCTGGHCLCDDGPC